MDRTIEQMLTQCKMHCFIFHGNKLLTIFIFSSYLLACVTAYAGECVMGKIPIDDFLHRTCETSKLSLGERLQSISTVSMQSCRMKVSY